MLFGNRAEGAGCAQLFDYITLITELWLLGSGLDDVFVGRSGSHCIFNRCTEILRCVPKDRVESSVFHCMIMSNEMSDLDGILFMQKQAQVSYCNYSFIVSRHTRELLGSMMPTCAGLPILQPPWCWYTPAPKFLWCSGNQQDSKNCGNEAAFCINLIECP